MRNNATLETNPEPRKEINKANGEWRMQNGAAVEGRKQAFLGKA